MYGPGAIKRNQTSYNKSSSRVPNGYTLSHHLSASSLIPRWYYFLFLEAKNSFTEASPSAWLLKRRERSKWTMDRNK